MTPIEAILAEAKAFNERASALAVEAALLEETRDRLEQKMRSLRWRLRDINEHLGAVSFTYRSPVGEITPPAEATLDIPAAPASEMMVAPGGKVLIVKSDVEGDPFEIPPHLRKAPPGAGKE